MLAVISVLSHTLSSEIKRYSAMCVLLLVVALHTRFNSYKEMKLNRMETASLFISSFIILLEGVIHSPEGSMSMQIAVSVIITLLLVIFVGYMLFEWVRAYKTS